MPTYEYRCKKGHTFELFHSIRDDSAKRCPRCGSRALRVPSGGAGLLFKGSGFYVTDYRSQSYQDRAKQESSASNASPPEGKKDSAAPAAKKESSPSAPEGKKSSSAGAAGEKKKESRKGSSSAAKRSSRS
jgi:putative FmdB family regulatory protein